MISRRKCDTRRRRATSHSLVAPLTAFPCVRFPVLPWTVCSYPERENDKVRVSLLCGCGTYTSCSRVPWVTMSGGWCISTGRCVCVWVGGYTTMHTQAQTWLQLSKIAMYHVKIVHDLIIKITNMCLIIQRNISIKTVSCFWTHAVHTQTRQWSATKPRAAVCAWLKTKYPKHTSTQSTLLRDS